MSLRPGAIWQVKPYAVCKLPLPFSPGIEGGAYDPATGRIFVSEGNSDNTASLAQPLMAVLKVG